MIYDLVSLCFSPVPCFEGITGPLEQVTLHGDSILGIHIVLQLGVVIRKVLEAGEAEGKR